MQKSNKDPAIKLFGKEIPFQENLAVPCIVEGTETCKVKKLAVSKVAFSCINGETEKLKEGSESPESRPDKTLKKPDKILSCPRCKSMDTKFCYYNNYNVNQPRHFCKACQRYWTAGGSMRNVPVGAGRRKTKNSSLPHNRLVIAPNARMLSFNLDSPMFESSASASNLEEEKGTRNGDHCSCATSIRVSNSREEKGGRKLCILQNNVNGLPSQIHCFAGFPYWPYPWRSALSPMGAPMSLYPVPTAYWNCPVPGAPTCVTLGKRSRDCGDMEQDEASKQNKSENGCVLVPKTLRIDDPREAAKSSIWATLGIKNESMSEGGMFKAFRSKGNEKKNDHLVETSPVLLANPAALSRSLDFHETS